MGAGPKQGGVRSQSQRENRDKQSCRFTPWTGVTAPLNVIFPSNSKINKRHKSYESKQPKKSVQQFKKDNVRKDGLTDGQIDRLKKQIGLGFDDNFQNQFNSYFFFSDSFQLLIPFNSILDSHSLQM